jgi:hypothetical protein
MGQGVVIEKIHYFSYGNQIFLITTKGGLSFFWQSFVKNFSKACGITHFFND